MVTGTVSLFHAVVVAHGACIGEVINPVCRHYVNVMWYARCHGERWYAIDKITLELLIRDICCIRRCTLPE